MADEAPKENKKRSRLRPKGCLLVLLVVALIAFGTAIAAVHTESGRKTVEARLAKWLSMDLRIESARFALPCDVVVKNVESRDFGTPGAPGFKAQELRLGWRGWGRGNIAVYRCALHLVRDPDGGWAPDAFSRLGELPKRNIAEISRLTSGCREGAAVEVSEGVVTWSDAAGGQEAEASGIAFRLTPVSVPGRRMYHYYLAVYGVTGADGARGHDIEREWLASDAHDYLELYREGRGRPPGGQAFWEGKQ
jgi:hypothetical protein